MRITVEYFDGQEVKLYEGIMGILVNKRSEEEIEVSQDTDIENLQLKEGIAYVHNSAPLLVKGVEAQYILPKPMKLLRIGIPASLDNPEQVQLNWITFHDKDYQLIGVNLTETFDKPFVILEFDGNYTRVILKDEFANVKPKKEKVKKAKRKKRSAKRTSKKQKAKSKSTRKS